MLASRSGLLRLEATGLTPKRDYELHLDRDYLVGLLVDSREVTDVMLVRDAFRSLLDLHQGTFAFENRPSAELRSSVRLPVKQLVLSTATAIDELAEYRNRFSHPDIVFQLKAPIIEHLPGELELFYLRAEEHLLRGCSASELSERLQLSVEEVQLQFYKLRTAGSLVPVRSYVRDARAASSQPAKAAERSRLPLLSRLRNSLARLGRGQR